MTFNVSGDYIPGSTAGRAGNVSIPDQVLGGQQGKPPMSDERLQMMLAYSFGFVFVVCVLVLIVLIPNPTLPQFEVFRIVMALAAGGIAAVVPGLLHLTLSRGQGLAIRAGGAMAVFVIVYFYSPASWIVH
jgi:MFS family permease